MIAYLSEHEFIYLSEHDYLYTWIWLFIYPFTMYLLEPIAYLSEHDCLFTWTWLFINLNMIAYLFPEHGCSSTHIPLFI